jgi:hypothetical protein
MSNPQSEPESTETESRPLEAEEPVQSIEDGDPKDDADAPSLAHASEITEDQWKIMMEVVMAIYDYREEECVFHMFPEWRIDRLMLSCVPVAMTPLDSSTAVSISATSPITTTLSKSPWRLVS